MYEDCSRHVVSQGGWMHNSVIRRELGKVGGVLGHARLYLRRETWEKEKNSDEEGKDIGH